MKFEREKKKELKRTMIYNTAVKIFCELGYEKTSIRDIAEATGMTKAGLYYYFRSKEQLLFQILDSYMNDSIAGIRNLHAKISEPLEFIQACIDFQVKQYCRDMYRNKLIIHDENCLSRNCLRQIKDKEIEYLSYWKDGLEKFCKQENIKVDNIYVYVQFLIGMCNWIYQWYDPKKEVKPEVLAQNIFGLFFKGIVNQSNSRIITSKR